MPVADLTKPLIPEFDVIVDGTPLDVGARLHIVDVAVDDNVDLPGMFSFSLVGSDDQEEENPWVDEKLFSVGKTVEIKMGYANNLESLIKGEITALEPEFARDRLPSMTVRGYDRRHRLLRGRKTRTFVKKKDSEIASQIASESGLTGQAEDSKVTHEYVVQANQTDMDFLRDRARRIQYEVMVDDKKLIFRAAAHAKSEIMTIAPMDHLLEFYPRLTSTGQVGEVNVRGWNPKEKKEIVGKGKSGDEVSTMGGQKSGPKLAEEAFGEAIGSVSALPVMTQAEADQIAKARLNEVALELIEGQGACLGRTDLRAGKVIKINGIGKRFGGKYYVTSAIHRYSAQDGYLTHFTVRRNAL
jgi:Bacteriophage probable baseplate hub protein